MFDQAEVTSLLSGLSVCHGSDQCISVSDRSPMRHVGLRSGMNWSLMGVQSDMSVSDESPIGGQLVIIFS